MGGSAPYNLAMPAVAAPQPVILSERYARRIELLDTLTGAGLLVEFGIPWVKKGSGALRNQHIFLLLTIFFVSVGSPREREECLICII